MVYHVDLLKVVDGHHDSLTKGHGELDGEAKIEKEGMYLMCENV
jgi:hypothetical protein